MAGLPAQPSPLIGRLPEVALTRDRLLREDVRLLTLVGAAGTGKTRLAVEVASQSADEFADGAYFVDLAPIDEAALLGSVIAQTIDVREERDRPLLDVLKTHLAGRNTLLVLDNFEQLLPAALQLSDLLQACPQLRLLVTSRSALRLRWESVVPVPPLEVPSLAELPSTDKLAEFDAVKLFVQVAQRADPHFKLTDANARAVASICVRLDGLPLAIELAAARIRVLPPEALSSRLGHRLDLLAGTSLDQPIRQRTLRGALDWSYDLLSPAEQALFRRLSAFVGGFPLGAVAEVCDPEGVLDIDPLGGVESLVDKSLLRQELAAAGQTEPRFGMLETVREYALERLAESGEREVLRRRHAAYYLGGADVALAQVKLSQQTVWLQTLEAEHENLRAALAWCLDMREPELGLRAAGVLAWFWIVRGYVAEGRRQLASLVRLTGGERSGLQAEALRVIGSLALHQADYAAARALFEESLVIRRELGQPSGLVGPLSGLGAAAMQQGDIATAQACFEEQLAIQETLGDGLGMAESLNSLANLAHERGELDRARALYERARTFTDAVSYRTDVVLHNLGVVAQEQGDLAGARQFFQDSVAMRRALSDTSGLALSLAKLGEVVAGIGDQVAAHHFLSESLMLQHDLGDRAGVAFVLERFAMTAAAHERPERALRLGGAADGLRQVVGAPLGAGARQSFENWLEQARRVLAPQLAAAAWEAGRGLPLAQAIAEALTPDARAPRVDPGPAALLSAREREVAVLVAQGLSNRDIAERLVVSERTAENHVQRVLNRLGLRSRAQVAVWAVRHGLAEPDSTDGA